MATETLSTSRICADVATRNLKRARSFYEVVLGLVPVKVDERRGVYYRAGGGTMLNLYERAVEPSKQTVATFLVHDISATMTALHEAGIRFENYDEPDLHTNEGLFADDSGFKACWFRDPDGNLLGLEQLP